MSESDDWPLVVRDLITSYSIEVVHAKSYHQAREPSCLAGVDAVLLCDSLDKTSTNGSAGDLELLADALISHRLIGVALSPGTSGVVPGDRSTFVHVSNPFSTEELWGRLATVWECQPLLRKMEDQVAAMQRLGKKLNQQFVEVDQELRLASRLQRDFLPKALPEVGDIGFAALYRPATWVSGDVYDVRRLDEAHVGFYAADAVGHGVAAGLLTMFIKQAIIGKRILDEAYAIVAPSEVLANLNVELAKQDLPNCQFVTACYGTVNVETHELTFARGGHPHPIHVSASGQCVEARTIGGLLGVFAEESFPSLTLTLQPGEKLIIYSDGLEDVLVSRRQRNSGQVHFTPEFEEFAPLPARRFLDKLAAHLDHAEGSIAPLDDQTCLIIERSS